MSAKLPRGNSTFLSLKYITGPLSCCSNCLKGKKNLGAMGAWGSGAGLVFFFLKHMTKLKYGAVRGPLIFWF